MSFFQFLSILRARWLAGLAVFLTVVGVAVAVSLVLPKKYTATAAVLIDVKTPDPLTGVAIAGMMLPSYMATQVDVITQSDGVVQRVVQSLGLNTNDELRAQWLEATDGRGDFEAWIGQILLKNLDIKPSRESNALSVSYTSPDGRFAAALANAFVQAYIDTSVELRTEPARQYNAFFEQSARRARDNLEAAQAKLSAYQQEKGLLATDERFDVETVRLQELSSQLVMLQALAAESGGRSAQANVNAGQLQEVINNPLVAQLTADISRQQARLEELSSRLGEANPQVVELKANIAELQRRLAGESRRVAGSVGVNNAITQARVQQAQAAVAAQRARVLQLKQQRDEAAVLEREVETARAAFQAVSQRQSQTGIESTSTQTNVSFLRRATEPPEASSPKLLLNTAVAIFLGTLLAVATALLRELMDRRLRTPEDVLQSLQVPLLGRLPESTAKALARGRKHPLLQRREMAGLPRLT